MVGGDKEVYEEVLPILKLWENYLLFWQIWFWSICKMSNQIAIASNMMGVCEAVAYAKNVD